MTKRFCDVCGKPAIELPRYAVTDVRRDGGGFVSVSVALGFDGHPGGFGGPPDLCERHIKAALVEALAEYI